MLSRSDALGVAIGRQDHGQVFRERRCAMKASLDARCAQLEAIQT
jgi:hypothetical protein